MLYRSIHKLVSHHNIPKGEKIFDNNQTEKKSKHASKPLEFRSSIVDDAISLFLSFLSFFLLSFFFSFISINFTTLQIKFLKLFEMQSIHK